jgi:hypothetical protein
MEVSLPFRMPSTQLATWQTEVSQMLLTQSLAPTHPRPTPQPEQPLPPQSMSVSVPL